MEFTPAWFSVSLYIPIDEGHNKLLTIIPGQQDAPDYIPGIIAVMAINVAAVVAATVTMIALKVANKRADEGKTLCEGREGFRYTL